MRISSARGMSLRLRSDSMPLGEFDRRVIDIDGTKRTAHAANVGTRGFALLLVTPRLVRIHRHRVHPFPIERLAITRHLVVPYLRCAHPFDQVARMGRDTGCDYTVSHVGNSR